MKIILQGKTLESKENLFLQDGTVSLGVLRDNYDFFQRIVNPLADKKVKAEIEKCTKEFTQKITEYNKGNYGDVTKLLIETEQNLWEAEKRSIIENALIGKTTKEELVQLCKSIFIDVSEIDFKNLTIFDISDAIEEIKKKQLKEFSEKQSS